MSKSNLQVNRAYDEPSATTPPFRALFILLVIYICSYVDRVIMSILAVPLKADLALTDTRLGLLAGLPFVLFYVFLGIPVAWLADRYDRIKIVTAAVAVWSVFTISCGLAHNFWQLALARVGVGTGEAGGTAPSYALIADYFSPAHRARALAVFSFGIPIGSALGLLIGGWIASYIHWRAAFIIVGFAGFPLAVVLKLGVKEPVRGAYDQRSQTEPNPTFSTAARLLTANPSFWLLSLAGACCSIVVYGLMFWMPSFFARSWHMALVQVSYFYAPIVLCGGLGGMWLGGWLGDRLGHSRPSAYAIIPAISLPLCALVNVFGLFVPSLTLAFFALLVAQTLGVIWVAPLLTALQNIVRPNMRVMASASYLFIANLIGVGFGGFFFGFVSDQLVRDHGVGALRYAILYGLGFNLLGSLLFVLAARRIAHDWHSPAKHSMSSDVDAGDATRGATSCAPRSPS
jgi:MFS family permease